MSYNGISRVNRVAFVEWGRYVFLLLSLGMAAVGCGSDVMHLDRLSYPMGVDAVFTIQRPDSAMDFDTDIVLVSRAMALTRVLEIPGRGARGIGNAYLSPDGSRVLFQMHSDGRSLSGMW